MSLPSPPTLCDTENHSVYPLSYMQSFPCWHNYPPVIPPAFFKKNTWCFSWCSLSARLLPVEKSQWFPLVFLLLMWENHVLRVSNIWLERIGTITYTHYGMCFAHEWYQPINAHAHASGLNIPGLLPLIPDNTRWFFSLLTLCWHCIDSYGRYFIFNWTLLL